MTTSTRTMKPMTTSKQHAWVVRLVLLLALGSEVVASMHGIRSKRHLVSQDLISCHVAYTEILTEEDEGHDDHNTNNDLYCLTKRPGKLYRETIPLQLPADFVQKHAKDIDMGNLSVTIPAEYLQTPATTGSSNHMPVLVVPNTKDVHVLPVDHPEHRRRHLSKDVRSGNKRLLAVRLLSHEGNEVPTETMTEIRNAIFGATGTSAAGAQPTVVSQYAAASHGALQFVPAQGTGIEQGVVEITMQAALTTGNVTIQGQMLQQIVASTATALGQDLDTVADHIIFCLPTGSLLNGKQKWTAFTYLYEPYSYYQRSRCTKLSVPMHELGHGVLGFKHSGKGRDSYADEQGYMGYAINQWYGPQKAFNAHKHWMSGWFGDRAVDVQTKLLRSGALGGRLVSFVDASNLFLTESDAVVLKLGHLYIQYNLAKGYNKGTYIDQKNRVTVNYAEAEDDVSDLVAALTVTEKYTHANFAGSNLIIEVCSFGASEGPGDIDYAVLSIHLDDGIHSSLCSDPTIVDNGWRGVGQNWLSFDTTDTDTAPSAAPTFNEDSMAVDPDDDNDEDIYGSSLTPAPAPTESTTGPDTAKKNDNPGREGVNSPTHSEDLTYHVGAEASGGSTIPHDSSQPEVLEEDQPVEKQYLEIPLVMIAMAGGSFAVLVALILYCFCRSTTKDPMSKPEQVEITETDLSDRDGEDDILEVRMVVPPAMGRAPPAEEDIIW